MRVAQQLNRLLRRLGHGDSGQVLVTVAISMTVLLGMTALAVDGGNVFTERRYFQAAADAGALAGAWELDPKDPSPTNQQAVRERAEELVYSHDPLLEVTVTIDPDELLVRVSVRRPVKTSFGSVLGLNEVTVGARAAAVKTPVLNPTEGILPVGYKDPRFDDDGNLLPEWDDGTGRPRAPEDWVEIFADEDILEPVPGQQYIQLRAPAGGGDTGNFYPLNLEPWHPDDPCAEYGGGANLYRCHLEHGGWLEDAANPEVLTVTEPGNMSGPTFTGMENRLDKAHQQPCTIEDVLGANDAEAGVYGNDAREIRSDCARLMTVPLLQRLPKGASEMVPISGWLRMAAINVCNSLSANPLDPSSCKQSGQPAIIFAKLIEPATIQGVPGPSDGRSNMMMVRLVE